MNPEILNLNGAIVFFPVRHHSPAAAQFLRQWIEQARPEAILIEGPSDFNDRLAELQFPHHLPIAIYSYVQAENRLRRGAFYPFCIYSPEWQALQTAFSLNIPVQFIDRPWAEMVTREERSHRYADGNLAHNEYVALLCEKVGVEDFDTLWDTLFEIDANLSLETYFERCHWLCFNMRRSHFDNPASLENDRFREAFMVQQIRSIQAHLLDKNRETTFLSSTVLKSAIQMNCRNQILVVTGGFHSYALFSKIYNLPFEESPELAVVTPEKAAHIEPSIIHQGIALTPYSYDRLDRLTGYESGMANPGFYHQIWNDRNAVSTHHLPSERSTPSYQIVLANVVSHLREQHQGISAADLIAVETIAQSLAQLRGHSEVWRQDLIDGIIGALVKEELSYGLTHPLLEAVYKVFRGNDRGCLAIGTPLPPLVQDLQLQLKQMGLEAHSSSRIINLILHENLDLKKSQLLYQLCSLGIAGYTRIAGTDLIQRNDLYELWEQWEISWSPEFEANCIEAAIYGSNLTEAVSNRLLERAQNIDRSADQAALLLLEACLMGLPDLTSSLDDRLRALIRQDSHFLQVSQALGHLLYLYRYDTVLGHIRSETIASLLTETFHRSLWLLNTLGTIGTEESQYLQGLKILLEVFERCPPLLGNDRLELIKILEGVSQNSSQMPSFRGGAVGTLWRLGVMESEYILQILYSFASPEQLGDFLTGLLRLAREIIQRYPELIEHIDQLIMGYSHQRFLEALPALRLAFSSLTPREKYQIGIGLFPSLKEGDRPGFRFQELHINPAIVTAIVNLETEIINLQKYYDL